MPIFSDFFKSRRNKINCTYRACVECFNDVDCNGNLVCYYGKCITRQQKQKLQQAAAEAARRREEQRQRDQQQTAAGAAYVIQQQEKKRNEK